MKTVPNIDEIEQQLYAEGFRRVMGLDEVGRGCLAGPVVAAGVILNPSDIPTGIYDSKALHASDRERLFDEIQQSALFSTIQWCSPSEIDKLNILWASMRAMEKCEQDENARPDYLLIDGNRYLPSLIPHQCVVKGDQRSVSIAAASILAKVYRDRLMRELSEEFPHYGWERNVGYPTKLHYDGLAEWGITRHHRRSFNLRTSKMYSDM